MSITLDGNNSSTVGVPNFGTVQNTTSGTSITFTGIPAGVKRITLIFNNVSTSGSSLVQVQLGAGSIQTTGYNGATASFASATPVSSTQTTGFFTSSGGSASDNRNGTFIFTYLGTGNIWIANGQFSVGAYFTFGTGQVALSGTLDRLTITTVNGTDTFDNGSVNIIYE